VNAKTRSRRLFLLALLGCLAALCVCGANVILAGEGTKQRDSATSSESRVQSFAAGAVDQDDEVGSKGLKPDEAGVKVNPKHQRTGKQTTLRTSRPFNHGPAPAGREFGQIGVTIWRVDSGQSKGVEQEGVEQTIERVDTNAPYTNGDTIRLRFQSPSGGYLYVVDQEQYVDGSTGPAILVFPTLTTRKGNNLVEPWNPIEIPAYPSVWRFKPRALKEGETRKVQTAELLTIILSPKRLVDVSRISRQQLTLKDGEFEAWLAWKAPVQQFDMENTVGQIFKANGVAQEGDEADEGEVGGQTIYRVTIKPGSPLLVTLPLRFKGTP